jgi:hypothetical protein
MIRPRPQLYASKQQIHRPSRIARQQQQQQQQQPGVVQCTKSHRILTGAAVVSLLLLLGYAGVQFTTYTLQIRRDTEVRRKRSSSRDRNEWHLQQLASVFSEIVSLHAKGDRLRANRTTALGDSTISSQYSIPLLDRSFFSRPPLLSTNPISVWKRRSRQSQRRQRKFASASKATTYFQCRLQTRPFHQWSLARIVVFQRNGGKQLSAFMTHYLHVLPPDAIVIVDHESDPHSATVRSLLPYYASLGVHVWNCEGDYEHGRAAMWTMVSSVYQWDSTFLFPTDIDELVTVVKPSQFWSSPLQKDKARISLEWDTTSFYASLAGLLNKTSGKPFKMLFAEPIPGDCPVADGTGSSVLDTANASSPSEIHSNQRRHFLSPVCELSHVLFDASRLQPFGCLHKCFARGYDFVQTDMGNHVLVTQRTVDVAPTKKPTYNVAKNCEKDGLEAWFETSNLLLLHMQKLEFADWMLHYIRGASMHGYTANNCTGKSLASHYCDQWVEFQRANFSIDALRPIYSARFCPAVENDPTVVPIHHVFSHACDV